MPAIERPVPQASITRDFRMIDEASLTKGQLRKLNALRKSIGPAIADKAFARQNAQRSVRRMPGSTAATRRHSGARPAPTSLALVARAGHTGAAAAPIDGRAGTADPARFEPAGPAALAGRYPAGQAPAEPDRDLAAPQGCRSLSAMLARLSGCNARLGSAAIGGAASGFLRQMTRMLHPGANRGLTAADVAIRNGRVLHDR